MQIEFLCTFLAIDPFTVTTPLHTILTKHLFFTNHTFGQKVIKQNAMTAYSTLKNRARVHTILAMVVSTKIALSSTIFAILCMTFCASMVIQNVSSTIFAGRNAVNTLFVCDVHWAEHLAAPTARLCAFFTNDIQAKRTVYKLYSADRIICLLNIIIYFEPPNSSIRISSQ